MRVKIGPYTNYLGPYQIAEAIFFWIDHRSVMLNEEFGEQRWDVKACEKLGDILANSWVNDFCNWVDQFKKRKVDIRIDKYDTWSMDHTLALIIHPMLVQLKEKNHGYFTSDPEDAPHIGKGDETDFGGSDSKDEERYNWIMGELIWTFDQIANGDDGMQFFSEENIWDKEANELYDDRIKNGLRLFGKYYRGLWD